MYIKNFDRCILYWQIRNVDYRIINVIKTGLSISFSRYFTLIKTLGGISFTIDSMNMPKRI